MSNKCLNVLDQIRFETEAYLRFLKALFVPRVQVNASVLVPAAIPFWRHALQTCSVTTETGTTLKRMLQYITEIQTNLKDIGEYTQAISQLPQKYGDEFAAYVHALVQTFISVFNLDSGENADVGEGKVTDEFREESKVLAAMVHDGSEYAPFDPIQPLFRMIRDYYKKANEVDLFKFLEPSEAKVALNVFGPIYASWKRIELYIGRNAMNNIAERILDYFEDSEKNCDTEACRTAVQALQTTWEKFWTELIPGTNWPRDNVPLAVQTYKLYLQAAFTSNEGILRAANALFRRVQDTSEADGVFRELQFVARYVNEMMQSGVSVANIPVLPEPSRRVPVSPEPSRRVPVLPEPSRRLLSQLQQLQALANRNPAILRDARVKHIIRHIASLVGV